MACPTGAAGPIGLPRSSVLEEEQCLQVCPETVPGQTVLPCGAAQSSPAPQGQQGIQSGPGAVCCPAGAAAPKKNFKKIFQILFLIKKKIFKFSPKKFFQKKFFQNFLSKKKFLKKHYLNIFSIKIFSNIFFLQIFFSN